MYYKVRVIITLLGLSFLRVNSARLSDRYFNFVRVINGTDTPPGKYPSLVSHGIDGVHYCGGTIINENWMLTAAHCVYYGVFNPSNTLVYAGSVDLEYGGTFYPVKHFRLHPDFNIDTMANDIALVRMAKPFKMDGNTAPVVLPLQGQITPVGSNATVVGWGVTEGGGGSQLLQEVDYNIVSDAECKTAHFIPVYDTNICAYNPGGGKGSCSGDSGGPLFVAGQQVGIVSWSMKPCTMNLYPDVYTEVAFYVDWINSHVNYGSEK